MKNWAGGAVYGLLMRGLPAGRAAGEQGTVAIVCLASLGDLVEACSAVRALVRRGLRVKLVCRQGAGMEQFAALTGLFEEVIALPHGFLARPGNIRRLKSVHAGTVLVMPAERHILSDLYALAITANRRILPDTMQGCSLPKLKRRTDALADELVPVDARRERERNAQYLRGAGLYDGPLAPFSLDRAEREDRHSGPIMVFPGAGGGPAKQWPVERFAAVAGALSRETGREVLVCGTEGERALGEVLCAKLSVPADDLCGRTDLRRLAELLFGCGLVLANDSGSAHMAMACGAPTVIVCGCWEYGRFFPDPDLPENCRAVTAQKDALACIPCGVSRPDCVKQGAAPCVLAVGEDEVLRAARTCIKNV